MLTNFCVTIFIYSTSVNMGWGPFVKHLGQTFATQAGVSRFIVIIDMNMVALIAAAKCQPAFIQQTGLWFVKHLSQT